MIKNEFSIVGLLGIVFKKPGPIAIKTLCLLMLPLLLINIIFNDAISFAISMSTLIVYSILGSVLCYFEDKNSFLTNLINYSEKSTIKNFMPVYDLLKYDINPGALTLNVMFSFVSFVLLVVMFSGTMFNIYTIKVVLVFVVSLIVVAQIVEVRNSGITKMLSAGILRKLYCRSRYY